MRALFLCLAFSLLFGCQQQESSELPQTSAQLQEIYTFEAGQFDADSVAGMNAVRELARDGDEDARFKVAFFDHFMEGDYREALRTFEELAADGHLESAELLAHAYQSGKGVEIDYDTAAAWLARAAELGSQKAAKQLETYRKNY